MFHTKVLILPKLTSWLPAASDDLRKEYETYELADPSFYVAGKIDIILMQNTWKTGLNWDDPLPDGLTEQWKIYRENLQKINLVKIPRWVKFGQGETKIELHGFSDSSQKAYGAVIYLRVTSEESGICVHQMMAKSRVAPLKILTIPRLELKGALLLADLMQKVANSNNWNNTSIYSLGSIPKWLCVGLNLLQPNGNPL